MAAEHVLVLISVDPETSHRTNEAIRIALGIIAGENHVTIALTGPAARCYHSRDPAPPTREIWRRPWAPFAS